MTGSERSFGICIRKIPVRIAKKTICRKSPSAIALKGFFGTMLTRKSTIFIETF
jgi:hypothetical protein